MQQLNKIKLFTLVLIGLFLHKSYGQSEKVEFAGYLSNMFSYSSIPEGYGPLLGLSPEKSHWVSNHYIQNRLNLYVYPVKGLKGTVQMRNRLFYGDYISDVPGFAGTLEQDHGVVDLSVNAFENEHAALNMAIDRLWLQYTLGDLEIKAGRQRINWSQTFAFNPNDIFNTYSFFEVDYPERPGTDALHVSYYRNYASAIEAAISLDSANRVTAAGMYRFNHWNYDFQVLGGIISETDYVLGAGWSGSIKGAGFRGEASYFHPNDNFADTSGVFVTSLSFDYMFNNSLYLQFEGLYNQLPDGGGAGFLQTLSQPLSAKKLTFTEYTLLLNGSYPVNPLINATLSFIYYPKVNAVFAGPSVDVSVSDNIGLSLFWQTFYGEFPNPLTAEPEKKALHFGYFRAKWNF